MDAHLMTQAQHLLREIADLTCLIDQTRERMHDPDVRWARELFINRIGYCRGALQRLRDPNNLPY